MPKLKERPKVRKENEIPYWERHMYPVSKGNPSHRRKQAQILYEGRKEDE